MKDILRPLGMSTLLALTGIGMAGFGPEASAGSACPKPAYKDMPLLGNSETLHNVKRAVITGDISINDYAVEMDSDSNTGQVVIVEFPKSQDLKYIYAIWGANARVMKPCATTAQFNTVIARAEKSMLKGKPLGYHTKTYPVPNR